MRGDRSRGAAETSGDPTYRDGAVRRSLRLCKVRAHGCNAIGQRCHAIAPVPRAPRQGCEPIAQRCDLTSRRARTFAQRFERLSRFLKTTSPEMRADAQRAPAPAISKGPSILGKRKPGRAFRPTRFVLQPTLSLLAGRLAFASCGHRRARGVDTNTTLSTDKLRVAVRRDPRAWVRHNRRRGHASRLLEAQ